MKITVDHVNCFVTAALFAAAVVSLLYWFGELVQ